MDQKPGKRLEELRTSAGLSMAKLGASIAPPTSASQINKLEKGEVELTVEWARRLAPPLGVHFLEFFDGQPKLPRDEAALVELWRGMSENDRATVYEVANAMAHRPRRAS